MGGDTTRTLMLACARVPDAVAADLRLGRKVTVMLSYEANDIVAYLLVDDAAYRLTKHVTPGWVHAADCACKELGWQLITATRSDAQ